MRYFSCNQCPRTFEGTLALAIHKGRMHKTNGQTNGNALAFGAASFASETTALESILTRINALSPEGINYVVAHVTRRQQEAQ